MARGHVGRLDRLVGVMADAALAAHEQHRHRTERRHRHGVVTRAARQRDGRRGRGARPHAASRLVHAGSQRTAAMSWTTVHVNASPRRRAMPRAPPRAARAPRRGAPRRARWRTSSVRVGAAGNDVRRAGRHLDPADRRRHAAALRREHELRGPAERVLARVHRRRPGVAGAARRARRAPASARRWR